MSTLTIRFAGICCFLDPRPNEQDNFAKRVLLPVDNHAHDADRGDGTHIPYIELDILDRPDVKGDFISHATYSRDGVSYRRYHLSGDHITITNAAAPNPWKLNVLSTYTERVPSISKVTNGDFTYPEAEFFNDKPDTKKVAALFDMKNGDLHAGQSSLQPTRFSDPTGWPTRRLAAWVELEVPIKDGQKPMIAIESFNGNGFGRRTIELAETTDHITIGNQLQLDIEQGMAINPNFPPSPENFRAHYAMVYDLFKDSPARASAPRPQNGMTIRNGCVGTQYP
jgi:hypothetical protein